MILPPELLLIPVALLGAVVGSFLNVVIYRLPRGLSVAQPRRSFCPSCTQPILASDNIPVLSWLLLGGRCRHCRATISVQYPIVELLTALVFVMTWDALFVGGVLHPISTPIADWPIALAFLVLIAGLLACSVMDIEEYHIDIRITHFISAAGVALHALWGAMRVDSPPERLAPSTALVGAALLLGWALTVPFVRRYERNHPTDESDVEPAAATTLSPKTPSPLQGEGRGEGADAEAASTSSDRPLTPTLSAGGERAPLAEPASEPAANVGQEADPIPAPAAVEPPRHPTLLVACLSLGVAACFALTLLNGRIPITHALTATQSRALLGLLWLMIALIVAGMQTRPADIEMESTIQAERPRARRTAIRELLWLLPALAAGFAASWATSWSGRDAATWPSLVQGLGPRAAGALAGGGHALANLMFAAAAGWFVRIFFTLLFGKEAYGVGDIHIMAAIGAVGGIGLVLISFFVGAILALVGVAAFVLRRSARALPFGPWLAVGALIGLWLHDPLVEQARQTWRMVETLIQQGG